MKCSKTVPSDKHLQIFIHSKTVPSDKHLQIFIHSKTVPSDKHLQIFIHSKTVPSDKHLQIFIHSKTVPSDKHLQIFIHSKTVPSDKHLQIFIHLRDKDSKKKPNCITQEMCYFPFRTGVYVWVSVPDTIPSLCLSLDSDVVLLCIKKVYIVVYFTSCCHATLLILLNTKQK